MPIPRSTQSRIETAPNTLVRDAALVLAGSAFVALAAQVRIPLAPIPLTAQDFAVILVGATLGMRRGFLALAAYLAEGLLGLPVFANLGAGPTHLLGPTGGYLVAFPLAAGLMGLAANRGWTRKIIPCLISVAAANVLIMALGISWASVLLGSKAAIAAGLLPFAIWNPIKAVAAVGTLQKMRRVE